MSENDALVAAFIDVRRAYRIIWMYQRRVLDLVSEIAEKFDLVFYAWSPQEYDRLGRFTTDPTKNWAWDMLPLYNTSFLYLPEGADPNRIRAGDWMLEIAVISDQGYNGKALENGEVDASLFLPAEKTRSILGLYAWRGTKALDCNWFNSIWDSEKMDWPKDGELAENARNNIKIVGKVFELSSLSDYAAVEAAVANFKLLVGNKLGIKVD
jgi:hypothetical protein